MNVNTGDKVKYLNSTGGGVVKKLIDSKTVLIEDEDGFDVPISMAELIRVDMPEDIISPKKETAPKQTPKQELILEPEIISDEIEGNDDPKLYFALVPLDINLSKFSVYLINDCNYNFLFNYSHKKDSQYISVENATLEANTKVNIGVASKDELMKIQAFLLQGVFYKSKGFTPQQPIKEEVHVNPIKFFKPGSYTENDFFDANAMILTVYEQSLNKALQELSPENINAIIHSKENSRRTRILSKKENKEIKNEIKEVDLHIHELVENEAGLEPGDKLNIQIKEFEKELNAAIQNRLQRIVFIHGVGNGVLKMKIRSILDKDYKKLKYQDASYEKYKFGATMVLL